jgi:hypothetical protein
MLDGDLEHVHVMVNSACASAEVRLSADLSNVTTRVCILSGNSHTSNETCPWCSAFADASTIATWT